MLLQLRKENAALQASLIEERRRADDLAQRMQRLDDMVNNAQGNATDVEAVRRDHAKVLVNS